MILNLNDPSSIVAWWKVLPERHGAQLLAFGRLRPQFSSPIRAALRRIKADPEFGAVYARCAAADLMAPRVGDTGEKLGGGSEGDGGRDDRSNAAMASD